MSKFNHHNRLLLLFLFSVLLTGCFRDGLEPELERFGGGFSLTVGGDSQTRSPQLDAILDNMRLVCFSQEGNPLPGGSGSWQSPFHHKMTGVTRSGLTLASNQMRVGLWDVVMVSGSGASLTSPITTKKAEESLMYTYAPEETPGGGNSPLAHEIWYRMKRLPEIVVGGSHTDACGISRNVAMVRVIVERAVDVSTLPTAVHTISLHDVPDKISWAGTLLKTVSPGVYATTTSAPDVLADPLVGKLTFEATPNAGTFKSDTLTFIIPAHREKDFWSDALTQDMDVTDTITHTMNLSVSFTKALGGVYTKTVAVPRVARCNRILELRVKMKDVNVEIESSIVDWVNETVEGDVSVPYLNVSQMEAVTYDASISRVHFWTNQPSDSVYVTRVGKEGATTIADIDTRLDNLAGATAINRYYDPATQSGYIDIASLNLAASQPDMKIYLKAAGIQREITIKRNVSALALANIATPYVGTFHRWSQRGERIVTWHYAGAWTAYIDDAAGAGSDVVIDRMPSPAMADNSLYGSSPQDAELYMVLGDARSVVGKNRVYFRVGWKTPAPDSAQPRYATITVRQGVNNASGTVIQKLYIRQGEEPDYLFRASDPYGNSPGITGRPDVVKFSPYNLTDPHMGDGGANITDHNQLGLQPTSAGENRFTAYPTQAGAFFQWASNQNPRRAYHPTNVVGAIASWSRVYSPIFWNALGVTNEACPVGYRRPNDGSTSAIVSMGAVSDSEFRQSLYLSPQESLTSNTENSLLGYYADGFFDRRAIGNSVNSFANSAVSNNDKNVAYFGRLFFNPTNNASIFFPAAGYRFEENGTLYQAGLDGGYWSSSSQSTDYRWLFAFSNSVKQTTNNGLTGYSVRCVKNYAVGDLWPNNSHPRGVVYKITAGSDGRNGLILALDQTKLAWGDPTETTNTRDFLDGEKNVKILKALDPTLERFPAAKYCDDKGDGWYLAAQLEMAEMSSKVNPDSHRLVEFLNQTMARVPGAILFNVPTVSMWSSTEDTNPENAVLGHNPYSVKSRVVMVRCVRKF